MALTKIDPKSLKRKPTQLVCLRTTADGSRTIDIAPEHVMCVEDMSQYEMSRVILTGNWECVVYEPYDDVVEKIEEARLYFFDRWGLQA